MKAPPPVASTIGPVLQQAGDDPPLAVAEVGLAVDREDVRDRHAGGRLDLVVGVAEGQAEALREAAADGALAGAHQADEHDRARAEPRRGSAVRAGFAGLHGDPASALRSARASTRLISFMAPS